MASNRVAGDGWRKGWLRKAMWAGATFLLVLPAVAMRFTAEVNWDGADFVFAAILLYGAAGLVELAMRASSSLSYRAGAVVAIGASFMTIWANLAVGMIGSEDNSYNLLFMGVVVLALAGAVIARFRAQGMAAAMALAGVAQAAAALGGLAADPRGATFSGSFAILWLLSAALFHHAARTLRQQAG